MIWGIRNNEKVKATPKDKAICEICNGELIAKCGEIKIWHWCHISNKDCDDWYEPESEWHINWKNKFPKEQQEVRMGKHRADIRNKLGVVIELQNSSISSFNIEERENHYGNMIWLLNGGSLCIGLELRDKNGITTFRWKNPNKNFWYSEKPIYIDLSFREDIIKRKIESIENGKIITKTISEEVGNDFGDGYHWESEKVDITRDTYNKLKSELYLLQSKNIFIMRKIYKNIPCGGWGKLISKEQFLKEVCANGEVRKTT